MREIRQRYEEYSIKDLLKILKSSSKLKSDEMIELTFIIESIILERVKNDF